MRRDVAREVDCCVDETRRGVLASRGVCSDVRPSLEAIRGEAAECAPQLTTTSSEAFLVLCEEACDLVHVAQLTYS